MTGEKETAPAVQAEAVNGVDSAHVSGNDDRQPAASSQATRSVHLAHIPEELRRLPQWAVATGQPKDDGTIDKAPRDPRTGRLASTADPSTWATFDECMASPYPLVGFMLSEADPYTAIDLDDKPENPASDEDKAVFGRIVKAFASYAELSVSGRGVHIVVRGRVPQGVKRDRVEVYSSQRFMLFTGRRINDHGITAQQPMLDKLFEQMEVVRNVELTEVPEVEGDELILERARRADNAEKFERLWSGQIDEWPSASEADLALLSMLAFYTKSNEQVFRLFHASVLGQRAKTHRKDYLPRALKKIRGKETPVDMDAVEATVRAILSEPAEPQACDQLTFPPGLVGDIAEFIHCHARQPMREAALTGALAMTAGIVGRSYNISDYGLQQYLIFVADSGFGKEAIRKGINTLVMALQRRPGKSIPAADHFIGPSDFASAAGIISALSNQKCCLSMLGEIGDTFTMWCTASSGSPHFLTQRVLKDLYPLSGEGQFLRAKAYANKDNNTTVVESPNLTIVGDTTPDTLFQSLGIPHIKSGLLPRFTIIEYRGQKPERNRNPIREPSDALLDRLGDLVTVGLNNANPQAHQQPRPVAIQFADDAEDLFTAFEDEIDAITAASPNEVRELWNRANLKALKIAGLVAVGCNKDTPVVDTLIATWAIDFVRREVSATADRFARGDFGVGEQRWESIIREVVRDYLHATPKDRASYSTPKSLQRGSFISFQYLRRRLGRRAEFSGHRHGAAKAIDAALADVVRARILLKLSPEQMKEEGLDPRAGDIYVTGPSW